jgi:hypothetical protein
MQIIFSLENFSTVRSFNKDRQKLLAGYRCKLLVGKYRRNMKQEKIIAFAYCIQDLNYYLMASTKEISK